MGDFSIEPAQLQEFVLLYGMNLVKAVATLVIGLWIAKILVNLVKKGLSKSEVEQSLQKFFSSLVTMFLKVIVYITALSMLGVQMTSFIAILGAAGLAVGLALQGSLANFAGGVLILLFKPFRVGDYIEGNDESGTVSKIDILHTVLVTPDNQVIIIPNGQLANSPITNYSVEKTRRAKLSVGISYGSDIKAARKVILDLLNSDERTLKDPAPVVVLTELADSSLNLSARAWTKNEDYWSYLFENLERIKEELDKAGIEIPFPQRDIHLHQAK